MENLTNGTRADAVRHAQAGISAEEGRPVADEPQRVIDDEQLKKMLKQTHPGFFARNRFQMATLVLIVVNVAVFALEAVLSGFRVDVSTGVLVDMGAMYAPVVRGPADFYRFAAPMFLHIDLMHLLFNMVALYSVGAVLERVLGKAWFVALYFVSGVTGNVVSYGVDMFFGDGHVVSAGASTSVFGLFVAVALLGILYKGNRWGYARYSRGMLGVILVNVVYTLVVPGISVSGHAGGALGGLIGMLMLPVRNLRVPMAVRVVVLLLWLGFLAGLGIAVSAMG